MTNNFAPIVFDNGIRVSFIDHGNRYYGDFHRICIKVLIALPESFSLPAGLSHDSAVFERTLEKMGVTSENVDDEQKRLIDSFLDASRPYMEKDDFPQQLLRKIQQKKAKQHHMYNR